MTRRRFYRTTRHAERARRAPDLLGRDFTAQGADQGWVVGITYVPTWAGFLFQAVILGAARSPINPTALRRGRCFRYRSGAASPPR